MERGTALPIGTDVNNKIENPEMVGNTEALFIKKEDSQIENKIKIPVIETADNITCGDCDAHKKIEVDIKIVDVENKNVCKEENRTFTFKPGTGSQNYRLCEFEMSSDGENSSDSSSDSDSDSFFNELHKSVPDSKPVKVKDEVLVDVAAIRHISHSCLDPNNFTVINCIVKGHVSLSSPSLRLRLCSRFTLLATYTYFDPKDFSPDPSTVSKGLDSNTQESRNICKCIVPVQHKGTFKWLVHEEERWEGTCDHSSGYSPSKFGLNKAKLYCHLTAIANDRHKKTGS
ncbi:hypothetical protein TNCV_3521991 [Trichonephila clavipes]|nr:hypothetical protein TNCV_3521991 [Trichonephila clavipes]